MKLIINSLIYLFLSFISDTGIAILKNLKPSSFAAVILSRNLENLAQRLLIMEKKILDKIHYDKTDLQI